MTAFAGKAERSSASSTVSRRLAVNVAGRNLGLRRAGIHER